MAGPQDGITYFLAIDPDDTSADVDVTEYVQAFTLRKGRNRETDLYQPASAELTLLDPDRRFDPDNDDGPYSPNSAHIINGYGGLVPMRRMTVRLDSANVENYIELAPATSGLGAFDTAALSVTGNIDVRWFGTLSDWSSGSEQSLFNKWNTTGNQRSWDMRVNTTGGVRFWISTNGTSEFGSTAVAVPFADGEIGGIRFTRVQASGLTTVYFSTDNGATWTASATTTVLSAGSAIFDSTATVLITGSNDGVNNPPTGQFVRAELWNGIEGSGGSIAASPNVGELVAGRNIVFETFIDEQGNEWLGTSSVFSVIVQPGSRIFTGFATDWAGDNTEADNLGVVAVPATDGLGVLANTELDEIVAAHSGDKSGQRVARVLALPEVDYDDPTSIDTGQATFGPTTFGANALQYLQQAARDEGGYLFVDRNGTLQFRNRHSFVNDSSAELMFADAHIGTGIVFKRLARSSSADLLYNRVTGVGTSGTPKAKADATSQNAFKVRTLALGDMLLLNDSEVEAALEWRLGRFKDPESRFSTIEINTMSLPDADAHAVALIDLATLVTVSRVPLGNVPQYRYIDLPGTASNYVSAPDAADIDIVGNITIVALVAADDWTPAAAQTIVSKWTNTGNQRSYRLDLNAAGTLTFQWSTTGTDTPNNTSSVALAATAGVADGDWLWVAVTLDIDEAGSRVCRFWYSTDGFNDPALVDWTELGTAGGGASTSIFASTSVVNLSGHTLGATQPFAGRIAYASIRQGVGAGITVGGTERLTFNGIDDLANVVPGATSFTASTGETLTVNGSGVTFGSEDATTLERVCIVDGIEHVITPGSWTTRLNLTNADTRSFLVLDHPTLGRLNYNRLAY